MQWDVIIVGQGISGTMLSWFLKKEGKKFLVFDEGHLATPSKVAAGVINPVTGRRYVTSWMADELMEFAKLTYTEIGNYLGKNLLNTTDIVDFFPTPQMQTAFIERMAENDSYLCSYPDQNFLNPLFNYHFGCGRIQPVLTVHMQTLLQAWREVLKKDGVLVEEKFNRAQLHLHKGSVEYAGLRAEKIIFCSGIDAANEECFSLLPFSSNKGEALVVEIKDLPSTHIHKKGMLLVPLQEKDHYWLGSNYQWQFNDRLPSAEFRNTASQLLQNWLKLPFKIVEHRAAIRPATLERRPFVGFHPYLPAVGLLNGMGSKGSSLAPFFAHQLVQHYVHGLPITPEAELSRFNRILSK